MRRPAPRILVLSALFLCFAAAGLVTAARSRTQAALARGDLATASAIQDRLAWLRLDVAESRYALAHAFVEVGELDAAVPQFERALARAPEGEEWAALAAVQVRRGDPEAAIVAWEHGFETNQDPRYMHRASKLLAARGEPERAFAYFERALSVQTPSAQTHVWNANAARLLGLPAHQLRHLRAAVEFDPGRPSLRLQLAWLLATCGDPAVRNGAEAVRIAEALAEQTDHRDPSVLDTLGAALAADARYDQAVVVAAEARDLAVRDGDTALAEALRERIALYRSGRPYLQPPAEAKS